MSGKVYIEVDRAEFTRLYEEGWTTRQLAQRYGISPRTAARRLHRWGIQPKPQGAEPHLILRDKDWLYAQYVDQKKSSLQIAKDIGASSKVVIHWLAEHGIPRRPRNQLKGRRWSKTVRSRMSEAKKGMFLGADNPNWRGGKVNPNQRLRASYESKMWSKRVRERDGYKCTECGKTGRLHAHHIKSWKVYPELRWDVDNGITLCPRCHQKAHGFPFPRWAYQDEPPKSAGHSTE